MRTDGVLRGKTGFLVTTGRPRLATLEGVVYVVGRGQARPCKDVSAAQALLTRLVGDEKGKREGRRAAERTAEASAAAAHVEAGGLAPGKRVRFSAQAGGARVVLGYIDEIGARSILVTDDEGNPYRRAPSDVEIADGGDAA